MRIISKFKDYYDNVSPIDVSGKIWNRETYYTEIPQTDFSFKRSNQKRMTKSMGNFQSALILNKSINNPLTKDQQLYIASLLDDAPNIHYNSNYSRDASKDYYFILCLCGQLTYYVVHTLKDSNKIIIYDSYDKYEKDYISDKENMGLLFGKMGNSEWINKYRNNKLNTDILISLKSPVFIISKLVDFSHMTNREYYLIVNPSLKSFNIHSLLNPFEVYQEIDRFINNDMVHVEPCDFVMSDELKRDSKGMDKWSFKQRGPKERKKKKLAI